MNREGVDVSMHNGAIEWDQVPASFAFCKATDGLGWKDPTFTEGRVKAIREAGILFGAYHFAEPQPSRDGADEAEYHVRVVRQAGGLKAGDLPSALDIETSRGVSALAIAKHVRRFCHRYRELTGHRCFIYTGSFWRDVMANPIILTRHRLWLAAYTSTWHGWVPRAFKRPVIWQYSATGHVAGISGDVDRDRWLARARLFRKVRIGGQHRPPKRHRDNLR